MSAGISPPRPPRDEYATDSPPRDSWKRRFPVIGTLTHIMQKHVEDGVKYVGEQAKAAAGAVFYKTTGALGLNPAEFSIPLSKSFAEIFEGTRYKTEGGDYVDAITQFRDHYAQVSELGRDTRAFQEIARKIFESPLSSTSYDVLGTYLFRPIQAENPSFALNFQLDRQIIDQELSKKDGQGFLYTIWIKLRAKINWIDSLVCGNFPYLAGVRLVNDCEVKVLRHGVPVKEWMDGEAAWETTINALLRRENTSARKGKVFNCLITEEYRGFLDHCKSTGQRVLYCCLLNPREGDELPRIQKLFELSSEEKYQDVLHFIKMPADGFLKTSMKHEGTLAEYKNKLAESLKELESWTDEDFQSFDALKARNLDGFVPGSTLIRDLILHKYPAILEFTYKHILEGYAYDPRDLSITQLKKIYKEKKEAFMLLFCTVLRAYLIKELGITHYNNTCKDAIDRGAMHIVSDFLWDSFLAGTLDRNQDDLRVLAAWPAVMAKTQAVIPGRAEWIVSFANWIERSASAAGYKEQIAKEYKALLELDSIKDVKFSNPFKVEDYRRYQIFKSQGPSEIKVNLQTKEVSIDREEFHQSVHRYLLQKMPKILEKYKYPGLPFILSRESLNEITFMSEDDDFIIGEMGIVDGNISGLGGMNFTMQESDKQADLEVSVRWTVDKRDLQKKHIPISLLIKTDFEEELRGFEKLGLGGESKENPEKSEEDILASKRQKKQAIVEKNRPRYEAEDQRKQTREFERRQRHSDFSMQTEPIDESPGAERVNPIPPLTVSDSELVSTGGSLLGSPDESLGSVITPSLLRPSSDVFLDHTKPEARVTPSSSVEKPRAVRDIVMVTAGTILGLNWHRISSLFSKVFTKPGQPKSSQQSNAGLGLRGSIPKTSQISTLTSSLVHVSNSPLPLNLSTLVHGFCPKPTEETIERSALILPPNNAVLVTAKVQTTSKIALQTPTLRPSEKPIGMVGYVFQLFSPNKQEKEPAINKEIIAKPAETVPLAILPPLSNNVLEVLSPDVISFQDRVRELPVFSIFFSRSSFDENTIFSSLLKTFQGISFKIETVKPFQPGLLGPPPVMPAGAPNPGAATQTVNNMPSLSTLFNLTVGAITIGAVAYGAMKAYRYVYSKESSKKEPKRFFEAFSLKQLDTVYVRSKVETFYNTQVKKGLEFITDRYRSVMSQDFSPALDFIRQGMNQLLQKVTQR